MTPQPAGCPDCGRDIDLLGGNPDCPTCAAEPAADGTPPQALTEVLGLDLCDECGHPGSFHLEADSLPEGPDRAAAYLAATCWAQSICQACVATRVQLGQVHEDQPGPFLPYFRAEVWRGQLMGVCPRCGHLTPDGQYGAHWEAAAAAERAAR